MDIKKALEDIAAELHVAGPYDDADERLFRDIYVWEYIANIRKWNIGVDEADLMEEYCNSEVFNHRISRSNPWGFRGWVPRGYRVWRIKAAAKANSYNYWRPYHDAWMSYIGDTTSEDVFPKYIDTLIPTGVYDTE